MIGIKSIYQPMKSLLDNWSMKNKSNMNTIIIHGESGVGKTTLSKSYSTNSGFEPQFISDLKGKYPFSKVSALSFTGLPRIAIIDDADFLSKKHWKIVSDFSSQKLSPMIIIVINLKSVPFNLRKISLLVEVNRPSKENLFDFLKSKSTDFDDEHLKYIAEISPTWRSAELNLLTSPNGFRCEEEVRTKDLFGVEENQAILSGKYHGNKMNNHPSSLIQMAEYNHVNTDDLITGIKMHSESWNYAGLSRVLKNYLLTLRTAHSKPVPFRKNAMFGKGGKV